MAPNSASMLSWDNLRVRPQASNQATKKITSKSESFRKLPSVDELTRSDALAPLVTSHGFAAVTDASRTVLNKMRQGIAEGLLAKSALDLALSSVADAVDAELRRMLGYSLQPVINATGVILHTNLGRAPLSEAAIEHIRHTAASYSNLEFDLTDGQRGKRDMHVDRLFQSLFTDRLPENKLPANQTDGAHSSLATVVVNNNAAAVLLALNTLAEGGEVIVSRGELVEIGGSFRIPDVMGKSGAILREVGSTNRTRIADYENAINERTRLLLRVHRSNFEITGFTERASTSELAELARKHSLPQMEDLGSGALLDLNSIGIGGEDSVFDSLRSGIGVVTYSGDKLLGGPQAGLISGNPDLISRMRSNSLFRALRADKLTYAALEATLLAYVKRDHDSIPALRMMRLQKEDIGKRAEALAAVVRSPRLQAELMDGESVIGGGAAPSSVLPTRLLALSCDGITADALTERLRAARPPVIARIEEGRVILDLRTVFREQDEALGSILKTLGQ
ncbi:MAG TPA: L-seryl-tRNA(Sec) selenium transferase [Candidatus Sulfotelmatobacter sp.]